MFRSPPALRSGSKGSRVALSDSPEVERSLSNSSTAECADMPDDKVNKPSDTTTIEACVSEYLGRTDIFDTLVARLKVAVEDAVRTALTAANEEIARLKEEVANLHGVMKKMEDAHMDRADDLEQYTRRTNLRVYGIAETESEDTDQQIVRLCHDKLGVDLDEKSISRSHRVGQRLPPGPDGRPRPRAIIVRLVSHRDRRLIFAAKKKLKGSGVVVKEDLTARRQEVYRRAVEIHGLRSCWTNDGRVFWVDKAGHRGMATRMRDIKT